MGDYIVIADASGGTVYSGHHSRRTVAGDLENVRRQLAEALETLGYHSVVESPLQAKRSLTRKKVGKLWNSIVEISINLKPRSANTTLAEFEYKLLSATLYKGDHITIESEIDAIIAMAGRSRSTALCGKCGAQQRGDASFCRSCGNQMAAALPAEFEVLRLNNEIRAGHRANITGLIFMISTIIIAIPLILFGNTKGVNVGWALLVLGAMFGFGSLLFGMYITHRGLNPRKEPLPMQSGKTVASLSSNDVSLAGTSPAMFSVTDGTTEILERPASANATQELEVTVDHS